MKKIVYLVICVMLLASLSIVSIIALNANDEVASQAVCTNHNFTSFESYEAEENKHTYYCSNAGCEAYMVEPCYTTEFCGDHQNVDYLMCEKCSRGRIYIHNYGPVHMINNEDYYHSMACLNYNEESGSVCYLLKVDEEEVECMIEEAQVWRGFTPNRGHHITEECSECQERYSIGYFYPANHPNYFSVDNNCRYCTMPYPYHMDWDGGVS